MTKPSSPQHTDSWLCLARASNNHSTLNGDAIGIAALREGVPTPEEMDKIIAQEMTHMSIQEREMAENDVHGIASYDEEDPVLLEDGLRDMDQQLRSMKAGTVYEEAESLSSDYVRDRKLRLMFLRADRWRSKHAAERMIRFFDIKKSLFGKDKLVKDITLDDLSADDLDTLRSGYMQVSPHKDMGGRTIVVGLMKLRSMRVVENTSRAAFYFYMSIMESDETQKKGVVAVYYLLDATNFQSVTGNLRKLLPIHFVSLHMCYNNRTQYEVICMGVNALASSTKVRFRPHFGSHIECQYALTTFGIPRQALPVSEAGEMSTELHRMWMEKRKQIEAKRAVADRQPSSSMQAETIERGMSPSTESCSSTAHSHSTPGDGFDLRPNDVLFGRGKTVVEHPGNTKFRDIVGAQMDEYEGASRLDKTCMTEKIVQVIQNSDGRFLRRGDNGEWEEVDNETARKKVAHAFRNRRKLQV